MNGGNDSVEARVERLERAINRIIDLKERALSYRENDPETALMHARKAAEAICRQLFVNEISPNVGNLMLDQLIEKLAAAGRLPRSMQIALQTIQRYGNYAAHEQDDDGDGITSDYIQTCLHALGTVVEWYVTKYGRQVPPATSAAASSPSAIPGDVVAQRLVPAKQWWVLQGGQRLHLSTAEIKTRFESGELTGDARISWDGHSNWRLLAEIPEFAGQVPPRRDPVRLSDGKCDGEYVDLGFLVGAWQSEPDGSSIYIDLEDGGIRGVYCYQGDHSLTGVIEGFAVDGVALFARFEWVAQLVSGYCRLRIVDKDTLDGGWWFAEDVPEHLRHEFTKINDHLPAKHPWKLRRVVNKKIPKWAGKKSRERGWRSILDFWGE